MTFAPVDDARKDLQCALLLCFFTVSNPMLGRVRRMAFRPFDGIRLLSLSF